jgi:hypothetical protein
MEILYFGLDYLKIRYAVDVPLFESWFLGLSDNSNVRLVAWHGQEFQAVYSRHKTGAQLMFSSPAWEPGLPLFRVVQVHDMGAIKTVRYTLDFYGAFFSSPFVPLLEKMALSISGGQLSRVDVCCDTTGTPMEVRSSIVRTAFRHQSVLGENPQTGYYETLYLGIPSLTRNPRHLIRIYDKKADLQAKKKLFTLPEYASQPEVTRVEVQVNNMSIRAFGWDISRCFDHKFLTAFFRDICVDTEGKGTLIGCLVRHFAEPGRLPRSRFMPPTGEGMLESRHFVRAQNLLQSFLDNGVCLEDLLLRLTPPLEVPQYRFPLSGVQATRQWCVWQVRGVLHKLDFSPCSPAEKEAKKRE